MDVEKVISVLNMINEPNPLLYLGQDIQKAYLRLCDQEQKLFHELFDKTRSK